MSKIKLSSVEIKDIRSAGKGGSIHLKMDSEIKKECSILTGNYNRALFSIYCTPHGVKAGCCSSYNLCKNNTTRYSNEFKAGDEILTIDSDGNESLGIITKSEKKSNPMLSIKGTYKISGERIFKMLHEYGEDYFNQYRDIFHLKEKTGKDIHVLDIQKYKDKKSDAIAYLDVAITIEDAEDVFLLSERNLYQKIKNLKPKDKIKAYIQMPTLHSRHMGIDYGGDEKSYCLEK